MYADKINYDAASLLYDIAPDTQWRYCPACFKPVLDSVTLNKHPHAENLLKSLCCADTTQPTSISPGNFIEAHIASYAFPYPNPIQTVVIVTTGDEFATISNSPQYDWEQGRELINDKTYCFIWSALSVTTCYNGTTKTVPRHPNIGLARIY